jgi:site-specific recombinase XerD
MRAKSEAHATFRQLIKYAYNRGEMYYTSDIGAGFLRDEWGYPASEAETQKWRESTIRHKLHAINLLDWMHKYGNLPQRGSPFLPPLPTRYAKIAELYSEWQTKKNYAKNTIIAQNRAFRSFVDFLISKRITDVNKINGSHISDYAVTLRGHAAATMKGDLGRLRIFLKFLYQQGLTKKNMAEFVPSFRYGNAIRESHIWTKEELSQLLSSIDRSSPIGKRDYAASLLAVNLGIRNVDIINLKLENIKWDVPCCIEFVQSKTQKALTLPLPEEVGTAIIDYLKYGRPKTECQNVFVRHIAPYDAMRGFSGIFYQRVAAAGIPKKINRKYGLHSLRHTVATRMLEGGVEFEKIAPFLGHADESTLHVYLNSDIEHLRQCALSFEPEEVAV